MKRNGSLNSMQSKITTLPSITVALPRWISPWHSRMKPSALRWVNSGLRRSKLLSAQACSASSCSWSALSLRNGRICSKFCSTGAITLCAVPASFSAGTLGVARWNWAICAAISSMCAVVSSPLACSVLSSSLCGN
ncbi:hypothetical protein D3C84_831350 [compost metagenome]